MIDLRKYIELKKDEIEKFIVQFFNDNSNDRNGILSSALDVPNHSIAYLDGLDNPETKESMSRLSKIVDNAYSVTRSTIKKHILLGENVLFEIELHGHAGYPGGEYDRELGKCFMSLEVNVFILLMSEYFATKVEEQKHRY